MSLPSLDENSLDDLYKWLSTVPLSKTTKNIAKDFSDGVLVAELVAHFLPRYVNLSNFTSVSSKALKRYNWETLNKEKIEQALQEGRFRPSRRRSRSAVGRAGSNISLQENDSDTEMMMRTSIHDEALRNHTISMPTSSHQHRYGNEASVSAQKYHQCQQELLAKDEQIQKLYARIRHLERLSQLKEDRIDELTEQLDKITRVRYKEQHANLGLPCSMNHKGMDTPPGSSDDQSFITGNSLSPRDVEQSNSFIDLK